jgi:hypothetical protein
MSNKKKPKKLRTPNIAAAGVASVTGRGGGGETAGSRADAARPVFDYAYVKQDLTRIGVLAGSLIAVLVILSFILK